MSSLCDSGLVVVFMFQILQFFRMMRKHFTSLLFASVRLWRNMWFDGHCATTRIYTSSVTEVTVMQWCLHCMTCYMFPQITDAKTSISSGWSLRSAFTLLLTWLRPAPLIHIIMLDRLRRLVCLCWDPAGNVFALYPNKQRFRCMTLLTTLTDVLFQCLRHFSWGCFT